MTGAFRARPDAETGAFAEGAEDFAEDPGHVSGLSAKPKSQTSIGRKSFEAERPEEVSGVQASDPHAADPHAADPHPADPHPADPHPADPHPADPLIGTTIDGRYHVTQLLGEGGMGMVYLARHVVLDKPLAIKVLRPEVSRDEEIITRFRQEAQSASAIGNQHIIDILDFGTLPDQSTYFVMEFLDGQDMTRALENERPMAIARTVHLAKQLCDALGAAHEKGIVHRDLKPDNVYLVSRGGDADFVKVLDFGIAKVGGGSNKLTKAGQVFGTPHYMSPEQCSGRGIDLRTDIYALGVILYEAVTGDCPFDADNLMGVLTKHMYEAPVPPSQLPPPVNVPPAMEAVILKALSKNADLRYQTMQELRLDLERVEVGAIPLAVEDAVSRNSVTGVAARQTLQGQAPAKKLPIVPILAAAALLVGVIAVVLAIAFSGGDEIEPDIEIGQEVPVAPLPEPEPVEPTETAEEIAENMVASGSTTTDFLGIDSAPSEAEVYEADVLLGNTPLTVRRPAAGETLELSIRKRGFETEVVRLSSRTQETVRLTLTEELEVRRPAQNTRVAMQNGRNRMVEMTVTSPEVTMAQTMETPATMSTNSTMRSHSSEVIDPWARME